MEVELEAFCPELTQGVPGSDNCLEARLDVHWWGPGDALYEEWVDVTVAHPWKLDAQRAAARTDGAAVAKAEARKRTRYGVGTGGVQCAPFATESLGRMGA